MPYELIVDVVFRFINFGVLIALFVYAYTKYVRDSLINQRKEEKRFERGLQEQRKALNHQIKLIDQKIKDDLELCGVLQKKVEAWRAAITIELQQRAEQKNEYKQQQARRTHMREHSLQIYKAYQEIHPKVIEKTRSLLKEKFKDEKIGQDYNKVILASISK